MKKSIYDDGFTAQRFETEDWQGHCRKTTGASGGALDPSQMAEDYLGLDPSIGSAAAYCLRRFGNPNYPTDKDKSICRWLVTTPMEDVWLGIDLGGGGLFRFTINREIEQSILDEQHAPLIEWGKACQNWAMAERGVLLCSPLSYYGQCAKEQIDELFVVWGKKNFEHWDECDDFAALLETLDLPDGYGPEAEEKRITRLFWDEQWAIAKKLKDEYEAEFGEPDYEMRGHPYYEFDKAEVSRAEFYAVPFWLSLPEDSIERQVNAALYRTLQDLLRPVGVRDWGLNIVEERPEGLGEWMVSRYEESE